MRRPFSFFFYKLAVYVERSVLTESNVVGTALNLNLVIMMLFLDDMISFQGFLYRIFFCIQCWHTVLDFCSWYGFSSLKFCIFAFRTIMCICRGTSEWLRECMYLFYVCVYVCNTLCRWCTRMYACMCTLMPMFRMYVWEYACTQSIIRLHLLGFTHVERLNCTVFVCMYWFWWSTN